MTERILLVEITDEYARENSSYAHPDCYLEMKWPESRSPLALGVAYCKGSVDYVVKFNAVEDLVAFFEDHAVSVLNRGK